jgi:hypothetical protein
VLLKSIKFSIKLAALFLAKIKVPEFTGWSNKVLSACRKSGISFS